MATGIYAKNTALFELVDRDALFERIATGFGFTEGPVFSRLGFLLFSDLRGEKIHKYAVPWWEGDMTKGELTVFREQSNRANGLTFDHQGRLLTCETGPGRVTRTEKDGTITVLAECWKDEQGKDKRLSSPNDLACGIDGSIYFTDMPRPNVPDAAERTNVPAVYRITNALTPEASELRQVSRENPRANGIAMGPKHRKLYVADSTDKNIRVHDINGDGSLAPGRLFAQMKSDLPGVPDGLKTDEQGNVYSTGPGGVWVFGPDGKELGLLVPPEQPSNLNWGAGFRGLFITARTSVYYLPTKVPGTRTF